MEKFRSVFFHLSDFVRPNSYYLKTDATLG